MAASMAAFTLGYTVIMVAYHIVFALHCNILWASYMSKKDDIAFTKYFSFGVWGGPEKDLGRNL